MRLRRPHTRGTCTGADTGAASRTPCTTWHRGSGLGVRRLEATRLLVLDITLANHSRTWWLEEDLIERGAKSHSNDLVVPGNTHPPPGTLSSSFALQRSTLCKSASAASRRQSGVLQPHAHLLRMQHLFYSVQPQLPRAKANTLSETKIQEWQYATSLLLYAHSSVAHVCKLASALHHRGDGCPAPLDNTHLELCLRWTYPIL
jgi:hypothetical protein